MISVYSNYLDPLINAGIVNLTENPKFSEVYDQLRNAYNQGVKGILNNTRMISPIAGSEDYYCIIWQHERCIKWLQWVNEKITLCIGKEDYRTLSVRLRIATAMLNNLVNDHLIKTTDAIDMHLNLAENLEREVISLVNEDLPF